MASKNAFRMEEDNLLDDAVAKAYLYAASFAYEIMHNMQQASPSNPNKDPGAIHLNNAIHAGLRSCGHVQTVIALSDELLDCTYRRQRPYSVQEAATRHPEICLNLADTFAQALLRASKIENFNVAVIQHDPENYGLAPVLEKLNAKNLATILLNQRPVFN